MQQFPPDCIRLLDRVLPNQKKYFVYYCVSGLFFGCDACLFYASQGVHTLVSGCWCIHCNLWWSGLWRGTLDGSRTTENILTGLHLKVCTGGFMVLGVWNGMALINDPCSCTWCSSHADVILLVQKKRRHRWPFFWSHPPVDNWTSPMLLRGPHGKWQKK